MNYWRGPGNRAPSSIFKVIRHEAAEVKIMRIKLNADYTGCLDGVHPSRFSAGEEVDIPIQIASVLLGDGRASLPGETKMQSEPLANKMMGGPPENKAGKKAKR